LDEPNHQNIYIFPKGYKKNFISYFFVKKRSKEMKIVLDAGHGYQTMGKCSPNGMKEYEFNRAVAIYVKQSLARIKNAEIFFTHSDEMDVPLSQRTNFANSIGADVFVSIHANAFGSSSWSNPNGIETFVHSSKPKNSVALARIIQNNMITATGLADRGIKTANFLVLRDTKCPAILIEAGFMTNKHDAALLITEKYRKKCASAIATGLAQHLNL
jgi:N-acetylmuramoyl-L-alanine amidase